MTEKTERLSFESDARRWQAVIGRNPQADGRFYYGVQTTGVYCRPSCPSRRPSPENVTYFNGHEEARQAGYRPCKRCRPDNPSADDDRRQRVFDACRRIERSSEPLLLKDLAEPAGWSPFHFQRVFKSIVGLTPKQYAKACREQRLRSAISGSATVTQALYDAGYQSSGGFYGESTQVVGMTPGSRKDKGRGERIRFALGECSMGSVLVGATDRGLCTIALGDDPDELLAEFQTDFANAALTPADADFETTVANVIGLIENPSRGHTLPLDVHGTAFQKMVWDALSAIAPGQTANYAEVARRIGRPSAARAVAQACGANRLAVAIPCHRVVRSDGGLSGYRWGVARKQALLDAEHQNIR